MFFEMSLKCNTRLIYELKFVCGSDEDFKNVWNDRK